MAHGAQFAMVLVSWFLSTLSGARWMALLEREEYKSSPLYGRLTAFFYFLALLLLFVSS
jgi:hypothetical protein